MYQIKEITVGDVVELARRSGGDCCFSMDWHSQNAYNKRIGIDPDGYWRFSCHCNGECRLCDTLAECLAFFEAKASSAHPVTAEALAGSPTEAVQVDGPSVNIGMTNAELAS